MRGFDDLAVRAAFRRIEIDEREIRIVERSHAAHPGVLIDAGQVRQIDQRRAVVADNVVNLVLIVLGEDRLQAHPIGNFVFGVFLKEELLVDAVRIALERKRAVAQMRENQRRYGIVVVDDVALGDAFAGIEDFVEIGELEAVAFDVEQNFGGRIYGKQRASLSALYSSSPVLCSASSFFPHALFRILIAAQGDKHRRAQQSVRCKFQILDLGHQFGLDPGDIAQRLHGSGEGAFLGDQRFDLGVDFFERLLVESRAHLPGMR